MGFFKDDKQEHEDVKTIKKESLSYNKDLIGLLESDHKKILELYGAMKKQFQENNEYKEMLHRINDFKLALEIHLMVEDTQLYGYLAKKNEGNDMMNSFVVDVQNEMKSIAEEVILFIRKYTDYRMYHENKSSFLNDLEAIGSVLVKRVEMEESRLYTLYVP